MTFIAKIKQMTTLKQRIVLSGIALFYLAGAVLTAYVIIYS